MPVEGRGLSWKQTQEVTKTEGLVMSLATPESVQKLIWSDRVNSC
jgi:hypothetical protein